MKKAFIILLCVFAVFAIASCKNDPKPQPEPTPDTPDTPAVVTFDVTFDSQGGSEVAKATVEKDAKVAKPEDPTKEGATFYKWFKESTCENEYDFESAVTEAITLYAKWVNKPAAETQTIKSVSASDIVKLTATAASDGFQLQWLFDTDIQEGDVLTFKYKSAVKFGAATIRRMTAPKTTPGKLESSLAFVETEDEWQTFSYTIPAGKVAAGDKGIAVRLEPAEGKNAVGDVLYIKEITYKTATETRRLSIAAENIYYGVEPTIEREYLRLVATKGGAYVAATDTAEAVHNYDYDKFSLYWTNPNVQVNPGDVFSITFKALRNDPLTKDRAFTYSIRDAKKWFSEKAYDSAYPQGWSTFSEPDEDGWITATYVFPAADAEIKDKGSLTYPATFRVDFRDENLASPAEGREADILYIRNMTITSGGVTTNLNLDAEKTASKYASPTVEEYFAPAPAAE